MKNTNQIIAEYAGRAQACKEAGKWEKTSWGLVYTNPQNVEYQVDLDLDNDMHSPFCTCPECMSNMHALANSKPGQNVRNPGQICKHIVLAKEVHGKYAQEGGQPSSLLDLLRGLPENLKDAARVAYQTERRRLS